MQKRGGLKWILEGDATSGYFHGVANGRKKKCTVFSLEDCNREIRDATELKNHIYRGTTNNCFGKDRRD